MAHRHPVGRNQRQPVLAAEHQRSDPSPPERLTPWEQFALILGPPESDRDLSHPGHRLDVRRPDRPDCRNDRMDSGVQHGRQHIGDGRGGA
jgi:hypothetical protein